jgi:thioredoxin-like negative regulator of GroEL
MKLVKIAASWCLPCKALGATLHGVNHPLVENMEELDLDTEIARAQRYGVRSVPTLLIVDEQDQVIRTLNGNQPKEKIIEFLA